VPAQFNSIEIPGPPARCCRGAPDRGSLSRLRDDHCLDFAYNNLGRRSWLFWLLKSRWLPKAYVRYAYWIYVEPVINHRDFPAPNFHFIPIKDPAGRQRYYRSLMEERKAVPLFPRDCIIDTEQGLVCKLVAGQLIPLRPTVRHSGSKNRHGANSSSTLYRRRSFRPAAWPR